MKKKLLIFSMVIVLLFSGTCFVFLRNSRGTIKEVRKNAIQGVVDLNLFQKCSKNDDTVISNGKFTLTLHNDTGAFELSDALGNVWNSNPEVPQGDTVTNGLGKQWLSSQLIVQYYNERDNLTEAASQTESVKKGGLSVYSTNNQICSVYHFVKGNFDICVVYSLNDDGLTVSVPFTNLKENGGSKISGIKLLPYFNSVQMNEKGFLFVPDGCGAVVELTEADDNLSQIKYEQMVYGRDGVLSLKEQTANKEELLFPVFASGAKNGLVGLISEGDAIASIGILGEGKYTSYNSVFPICTVRSRDTIVLYENTSNEVDTAVYQKEIGYKGNFTVNYRPYADSITYVDVADATIDYYKAKSNGSAKVKNEYKLYMQTVAVTQKLENKFGIPKYNDYQITDVQEAIEMISKLKECGVSNISFLYYGAFEGGEKTTIPTKGKLNSKFSKNLSSLLSVDAEIIPMVNVVHSYNAGNGVSLTNNVCRGVNGTKAEIYPIELNTGKTDSSKGGYYILRPSYLNKIYENVTSSLKKYGFSSFGDSGINILSSDFDKDEEISRQDALEYYNDIMSKTSETFDNYITEKFYGYMLPYVTDIANLPLQSSMKNFFTYDVPFAQMVVSKFATYSSTPLNEVSTDEKVLLKMLEYGCYPSYRVMAADITELNNTYMQGDSICNFDNYFDDIIDLNEKFKSFNETANGGLVSHKKIASGVYMSVYGNGVKVLFNYNKASVSYEGITVEALSYSIVG